MHDIKIDYIIPCYYEENNLRRSLEALSKQTRKDALKVIVVNDCSPNTPCGYQNVVDEYNGILDITLVKTPQNSGPAFTKQFGVDAGNSDYFMIQDDDDLIASDTVIEYFVKTIIEHICDDDIISILGGIAMCKDDFSIIKVQRDAVEHGRLFYRKAMNKYNIRYSENLKFGYDDVEIHNKVKCIVYNGECKNIHLDKLCYLYRNELCESVVNTKYTAYTRLFKYIALDVELLMFHDEHYETSDCVYKCVNKKLFEVMFLLIILKDDICKTKDVIWNALCKYRGYLLSKIDTDTCNYYTDGLMFNNYRDYIFGLENILDYNNYIVDIDEDVKEDLYYTYLSNEETIFNCSYARLGELLKGE